MTRVPRAGIIVTLRCWACSGSGRSASRSSCSGDRVEHDPLLGHRQRGAEAAAGAATEGQPLIRSGLLIEPALGAKREGVGVDVLAVVEEQDADADRRARGQDVLPEPPRHGDAAADDRDHRTAAHALDDRRLDVLGRLLVAAHGIAQALVGRGCAHQPLPRPRQRVGGGLKAREHEREQLIAQLPVR